MKLLPLLLLLFIFGCSGEPENVSETANSDTLNEPPPPPSQEEVQSENENWLPLVNDGDELKDVKMFYCNIGIYQEPAIMVIESEVTDQINGDGDYAEVEGYYYYVKNQKNLDLSGGLDIINGQYMLTESYKGKPTGYMEFSTNDFGKNFWAVSQENTNQQEFNFQKIEPKNENAPSFRVKKQKYSDKHQVQDMSLEEEVFEEVEDKLAMVFVDDDKMFFDYSVVRTNFHMGSASGMAEMISEGVYVFYGEEGCELTFEVAENTVDVTEETCEYYHGFRANLGGSYSK